MKKYIKPTTEIETTSFILMQDGLGYDSVQGQGEYTNATNFDEKEELNLDIKQNLWDE
jgi:hypothetical protein